MCSAAGDAEQTKARDDSAVTKSPGQRFRRMSDDELAKLDLRNLSPAERHDRMLEINRRARLRARWGAQRDQRRRLTRILITAAAVATLLAMLVLYSWL